MKKCEVWFRRYNKSEAFPVNDRRSWLVVLALRDPHLLESAQRRQDGAANPHGILALWWCDNFDLHRGRCECCKLLRHSLPNACEHRGAARQHNVGIEILADIQVALHD